MQLHDLRIAFRHLKRNLVITSVNIGGLALGLAVCLLILLYVRYELTYDRFHPEAEQVYRIVTPTDVVTPIPLGPTLAEVDARVTDYTRILMTLGDVLIKDTIEKSYYESHYYFVDSTFWDVFGFPLVRGNPETVLAAKNSLVISERMAEKYFGDADPIGQILVFDVGFEAQMQITGILANPPKNAHFQPDFLGSMATFEDFGFINFEDWNHALMHTYVRLAANQSGGRVEADLPVQLANHTDVDLSHLHFQPVTAIHLDTERQGGFEAPGSRATLYTFLFVAVLVLLIACINFMNLATARAAHRAYEVGMRKVLGASRQFLVRQFYSEALVHTMLASVLAIPLVYSGIVVLNRFFDVALDLSQANLVIGMGAVVGLGLLVTLIVGSYPAFVLSRFSPLGMLHKGTPLQGPHRAVRRVLVVAQFGIGFLLLVGSLVAREQLQFLQTENVGFAEEQMLVLSARTYGHSTTPIPFEAMRNEFLTHPNVEAVAVTGDVPGERPRESVFRPEGFSDLEQLPTLEWSRFDVDYDFIETLGLDVVAGRSFERDRPGDANGMLLINETAWRTIQNMLGSKWDEPVGKSLDRYLSFEGEWLLARQGQVLGVVRDFHYESLHHPIAPLVFQLNPIRHDHFLLRVRPNNVPSLLADLEEQWNAFMPERPFEYRFLDAAFDEQYQTDRQVARLFNAFSGLSLLIAAMGLFGLTLFTTTQRTKEIGIRQVLGAFPGQLVWLLTKDVLRLVAVGCMVAVPLAYVAISTWLTSFAYHVTIQPGAFVLAAGLVLLVATGTIVLQTLRVTQTKPAEALRHT